MSRKSVFSNLKLLLAGTGLALAISTGAASASPLGLALGIASNVAESALSCGPGTHLGYEGKYCWPNHPRECPIGTHLGYEGKYCWRD
ncbi:hypothetical protein JQ621_29725 [Bradyrhizobium manausense]|uniref:hypothetical protein n=1 Tax=Bradyrhizobium manausense TaxID=989370 RepID=UPI001BA44E02|nr:hypothetical protein [Bradyrhizobium manausense]MBR1091656.1 hypothetical protein [Bradyrhizobium manausense]